MYVDLKSLPKSRINDSGVPTGVLRRRHCLPTLPFSELTLKILANHQFSNLVLVMCCQLYLT